VEKSAYTRARAKSDAARIFARNDCSVEISEASPPVLKFPGYGRERGDSYGGHHNHNCCHYQHFNEGESGDFRILRYL